MAGATGFPMSSDSIVFEQSADLNRHLSGSVAERRAKNWTLFKYLFPFFCCNSLILAEFIWFRMWLDDQPASEHLGLLASVAILPASVFLLLELTEFIDFRTKRRLRLNGERVRVTPAKFDRIPWELIASWRWNNLPGETGLRVLTLDYFIDRKRKLSRRWSMVLQKHQARELCGLLGSYAKVGRPGTAMIQAGEEAFGAFKPKARTPRLSQWFLVAAMVFWIHGVPLLGVGVEHVFRPNETPHASSTARSRKNGVKLRRFASQYFHSSEQLAWFCVLSGGTLTLMGAGCWAGSNWCSRKKPLVKQDGV